MWVPITLYRRFLWDRKKRKVPAAIGLEISPEFVKAPPGSALNFSLKVTPQSPQVENVFLSGRNVSGSGLPEGLSMSFDPPSGYPPFASTLVVSISPDFPAGSYSFLVASKGNVAEAFKAFALVVEGKAVKGAKPKIKKTEVETPGTIADTEIPLYPKSTLKSESKKGDWSTHVYTAQEEVEEVRDFYLSEMSELGWKLVGETDGVPVGLKYIKGETEVLITISSLELTTVSFMIGPRA